MNSQTDQTQAELTHLYAFMRNIFRGGLAGSIAGVLFLGLGSRAVMRISALLNPEAKGILTENENPIGEITLGGTLGLIIFIGDCFNRQLGCCWWKTATLRFPYSSSSSSLGLQAGFLPGPPAWH